MILDRLRRQQEERIELVKQLTQAELLELSQFVKTAYSRVRIYGLPRGEDEKSGIYEYGLFPPTDGGISHRVFEAMAMLCARHAFDHGLVDMAGAVVTESDRGGSQLLQEMGRHTGKELYWANQYPAGAPLSHPRLAFVDLEPGYSSQFRLAMPQMAAMSALLVDDILSKGSTLEELKRLLGSMDVTVLAMYVGAEKLGFGGREFLRENNPELEHLVSLAQVQRQYYAHWEQRAFEMQPIGVFNVDMGDQIYYSG